MSVLGNLHASVAYDETDDRNRAQIAYIMGQFYNEEIILDKINFIDSETRERIKVSKSIRHHFNQIFDKEQLNRLKHSEEDVDMIKLTGGISKLLDDLRQTNCFHSVLIKPEVKDLAEGAPEIEAVDGLEPVKKARKGGKSRKRMDLNVILKRKGYYHISFQQTFNKEGNISLNYSGGFRNLLGHFESWNYSYEKSLQKDKLSTKVFNLNFPMFWGNTQLDLGIKDASSAIDNKIVERKISQQARIDFPFRNFHSGISHEYRANSFNPDDVSFHVLMNEILPTEITRVYAGMNLFNGMMVQKDKPALGVNADTRLDKVFGDSEYVNLNLKINSTLNLESFMPSWVKKAKFRDLELKNSFSVDYLYEQNPGIKPAKINDLKHFIMTRGFDAIGDREAAYNASKHPFQGSNNFRHLGTHKGGDFSFQNSTKLMFNSFPYLSKMSNLSAFMHFSTYYSTLRKQERAASFNKDIRKVSGLGLNFNAGAADIEFLYNFWHGCKDDDKPNYFQVKFTIGE